MTRLLPYNLLLISNKLDTLFKSQISSNIEEYIIQSNATAVRKMNKIQRFIYCFLCTWVILILTFKFVKICKNTSSFNKTI